MLRTTLCCVLIAATSAMATPWPWVSLDPTPDECPVGQGAHVTYGADSIWGVFPNAVDDETYVARYGPLSTTPQAPSGEWTLIEELPMGAYAFHTGLTFQWEEGNALYVIGCDEYAEGDAYLYWYSPDDQEWDEYDIDEDEEFYLGVGASIVYVPNADYDEYNQVTGYIYCLPGNGSEFWRYGIEPAPLEYTTVQGIFPPDGSTIADQTPLFKWNSASPGQYRLQVSTDELFSTTLIDEVVYVPQFQVTSKLANETYYWRVGTHNGIDWSWGATHNFVLQGGFVQLDADIPEAVANGAALAYEADQWCWGGNQSIIAVVGGGSTNFYKYDVASDAWTTENQLEDTSKPQYAGTSLTTNDPTEEYGEWPAAAFGGSTQFVDRPYSYDVQDDDWEVFPSGQFDAFPQTLGPGATFVCGPRPWSYLTTGSQGGTATHYFYAIEPRHIKKPKDKGGSQAGDPCAGCAWAQVLASRDGIDVEYQLPVAAHVRAILHDAVGRQVGVLDAGEQTPGTHRLRWDHDAEGRRLSVGAYFMLLDMGKEQARLKAVVR